MSSLNARASLMPPGYSSISAHHCSFSYVAKISLTLTLFTPEPCSSVALNRMVTLGAFVVLQGPGNMISNLGGAPSRHSLLQSSSEISLPSSHCSPDAFLPSPQTGS